MYETLVSLLTDTYVAALPCAVFIAFCDLIVRTFLRVAFGGKLWFGK